MCSHAAAHPNSSKKHDEIRVSSAMCMSMLSSAGNLNLHVQAVHARVNNMCDLCEYKANNSNCLKTHVFAVHYKIKNFKC